MNINDHELGIKFVNDIVNVTDQGFANPLKILTRLIEVF